MRLGKIRLTMLVLGIALAAVVLGFAVSRPEAQETNAQSAETKKARPSAQDGWTSRCQDLKEGEKITGKYCEAVNSLFVAREGADPSTAQRIAEMAIGYPPGHDGDAQGVLILPLGILVKDKVIIEVDEKKALSFNVMYCEAGGCVATFSMDKGDIEKFSKGKEIAIKTQAATGQPVIISLSLANFSSVISKVAPKT